MPEAGREVVRDLYRFQVELLKRLERRDETMAVMRRMFSLLDGSPEQVQEIVDWLMHRQAWSVALEVLEKFDAVVADRAALLYRRACVQDQLGDAAKAEETAAKALAIKPENLDDHMVIGKQLEETRGLEKWAEAEFRQVLANATPASRQDFAARFKLSELLHDRLRELPAAEMLKPVCDLISKEEAAKETWYRATGLPTEAAIARMTVGAGLSVNLFADEARFPALANPVQMSFDTRGRLWVACWPSYPHAAPGAPQDDKLLVLEDTDGDGRADTATPFADDLHNPTGFELWNGGVLLAQAPDLVFLQDTDGDGRADRRERLLHGLSSSDTHHTANSFVLGPDGALYFQEGIFHFSQIETAWGTVRSDDACVWRFEPRTGRVERHMAYGFLNPHGHVFDDWGQDFVTDGTGNENFVAGPASGWLPEGEKHAPYFTFFAQRSRPAGGTELLSSLHLPPEFQGDLVIANVIGFQGLFRYDLRDDGAGFSAVEEEPLLSSSDPSFRPVDAEVGPDGALYVLDWHNPLIGHMQHHIRDPSRDHAHGRVYRVSAAGRAPRARSSSGARSFSFSSVSRAALVGLRNDRRPAPRMSMISAFGNLCARSPGNGPEASPAPRTIRMFVPEAERAKSSISRCIQSCWPAGRSTASGVATTIRKRDASKAGRIVCS